MKKLIMVAIVALSGQSSVVFAQGNTSNTQNIKNSTWLQRILRPPFKTIAAITKVTTPISLILSVMFVVCAKGDKSFQESALHLMLFSLGSYAVNTFSNAALEELTNK